jgi:hypothetical protein
MNALQKVINVFDKVEEKFDLDPIDLRLLAAAEDWWSQNKPLRVTDLVREFRIASSATVHYRVSTSLAEANMFLIKPNPEDMREKLVVKGKRFDALVKFIDEGIK